MALVEHYTDVELSNELNRSHTSAGQTGRMNGPYYSKQFPNTIHVTYKHCSSNSDVCIYSPNKQSTLL